jgi:hypothetical protein
LQSRLKLDDTVQFTPQLQDRLAVELLNIRGMKDWRSGKLTDNDFAHNLSMEWASLPDPMKPDPEHPGMYFSYYEGKAKNHSRIPLVTVYAVLAKARAAIVSAPAEQPTSQLQPFDRESCAKAMQQALHNIGLYQGAIDGKWGLISRAAYDSFVKA